MVLEQESGPINSEQKDLLNKGYQSNERMITLINDLLNVSRIEEGKFKYVFKKVDFGKVISEVVDEFKEEIKMRKIVFSFQKESREIPKVKVDLEKIRLVIENLIDNAIKYTPENGKVQIVLRRKEDKIEVEVADTGVGIPADQQKQLFSKLFRGRNVIRMQTDGSGLGLFIARNIVLKHGGNIWIESEEGKGTRAYFILPVAEKFTVPEKREEDYEKFITGF
ncbi:hypothetical protein COY23_03755 [bacterium (Candidatus Torokbacteria) CG_4_10_14_0_2_um_filter_35_8]|nr:MAG: hypothetical protein COY23_03755 [bacterium (Candidatus Torokbacteria) CG_4_10_14_0_2_um_filter_35_8]